MTTNSKFICSVFVIVMIGMFATSDTVQAKKRHRVNQWERPTRQRNTLEWRLSSPSIQHATGRDRSSNRNVFPFTRLGRFQKRRCATVPPIPTWCTTTKPSWLRTL